MNSILQWWVGKSLPKAYTLFSDEDNKENILIKTKIFFLKFIIHPVKRRIAKCYVFFLQRFCGLTVIGITGSAGKTTTKEMLASILKHRKNIISSFANIDPVYNIPTSILRCKPNTKYLILEMGVEYPGEMSFYLWLVSPNIGVITNVYDTHTLFLKNKEGVYEEKVKLVQNLQKDGIAFLNNEFEIFNKIKNNPQIHALFYGDNTNIKATNWHITDKMTTIYTLTIGQSNISIQLPLIGEGFIQNSLAAASVAYYLKFSLEEIKTGLEKFKPMEHRMKVLNLKNKGIVIDDTYNNNPEAARFSFEVLNLLSKDKKEIVIFGDMLELGTNENVP
jgi:UDP-N-acetylmuramoyl-tripeptide--D-alanyl-D-alanine ligase